ncbi:MAG: AMP-binding protein [Pseudonocardiaceae bacterium]
MFYTVADLLVTQAHRWPHEAAIVDGSTVVSYCELLDLARRCANLVSRSCADTQERVAILLPRSIDALAVYFGAHLARAVPVFINEQLRPRQVGHIVNHATVSLIFTSQRYRPLLRDVRIQSDRVIDVATLREAPLHRLAWTISRDLAALVYTSGSTDSSKAVMVSHDNLIAGATIVADYLGLSEKDRTMAALPWSFDYGLNQVLATFAAGGTVVVQRSAFAPDICRTLAAAKITGMAGVPSQWAALTGAGSPFRRNRYPNLRYVTSSGGPVAATTIQQIRKAQPHLDFYLMYGLTEAFRSTYLEPSMIDTRPYSIGKAVPNTEILVIGEDGQSCGPGFVGELVHRGPTVALGYWQDPAATARIFRPHPLILFPTAAPETVVFSGDYVRSDADGYLYYIGRGDEMFKSRGVRVTPTEIETEILASGMVSEAVAVALDRSGPDPALLVGVVPSVGSFALTDLHAYCQAELPPHMRPHRIIELTGVPHTPNGKTDRARARAELLAGISAAELEELRP